ncbi:MAG: ATP-binding cassette domain-containing protein [Oceanospirillaceae bacterium]
MISIRKGYFSYPPLNYSGRSLKGKLLRRSPAIIPPPVFSNLDFFADDGEIIGLSGHNGSGKTTLLKLIAGILPFERGEISLPKNSGCLIDINMGIDLDYTGWEALRARAYTFGVKSCDIQPFVEKAAEISQLGNERLSHFVKSYSTGMQMRLGFSMAMVVEFDCLLLDEWLSVGDADYQQYASSLLKEKIKQTPCVIIASHSKDLLDDVCTRTVDVDSL